MTDVCASTSCSTSGRPVFAPLGVGLATGRPAVVCCTSGTAAVNLHPAVVEAHHARVPLLVCTADRPAELRDWGAGQTIDQAHLFGDSVRWFHDPGPPELTGDAAEANARWRALAARAAAHASGPPAGPVHLNLPFREPLVPTGAPFVDAPGRAGGLPWIRSSTARREPTVADVDRVAALVRAHPRGLVVAGWGAGVDPDVAEGFARAAGWPIVADPLSQLRTDAGTCCVSTYEALLRSDAFARAHRPDLVVRIGAPVTSKIANALLDDVPTILVDPDDAWLDPQHAAHERLVVDADAVLAALTSELREPDASAWLGAWQRAEQRARVALDHVIDDDLACEGRIARDVAAAIPEGGVLVVASSLPVRALEWCMTPRPGLRVLANRGANGIDGFVSTAVGVAGEHPGSVVALCGDLCLLHDTNGLLGGDAPGGDVRRHRQQRRRDLLVPAPERTAGVRGPLRDPAVGRPGRGGPRPRRRRRARRPVCATQARGRRNRRGARAGRARRSGDGPGATRPHLGGGCDRGRVGVRPNIDASLPGERESRPVLKETPARGLHERWAEIARAEPLGTVLVYGALAVSTLAISALLIAVESLSPPGRAALVGVALAAWILIVGLGWTRGTLPLKPLLAAIGITLLFAIVTPSNQSGDVNSYVMYGRIVTVHHHNPFSSYPMHFEGDPMRRHVGALWQRTPDIYGLGFTVIMAGLAPVIGESSFLVHFAYQLVAVAAVGAMLWLLWKRTRNPAVLAFVGLNPLVAISVVNGGHPDALVALAVLAGVLFAVDHRPVPAGIAFAFAASVNFTALVAAGVLFVWAYRRWTRPEVVKFAAIVGAFGALPYLLMSGWLQNAHTHSQLISRQSIWNTIGNFVPNADLLRSAFFERRDDPRRRVARRHRRAPHLARHP